ncbi:hypothetical protein WJX74_003931 [Apatococcus lobatus]|uniref:Uncharacterized protein n=1 Tax=Apatococcus lobatus TaxID=904363 RepID=A0AAW1S647_9CHLO
MQAENESDWDAFWEAPRNLRELFLKFTGDDHWNLEPQDGYRQPRTAAISGLQLVLEEEYDFHIQNRSNAQIVLRHIFELLEHQTVEPWSYTEVEQASSAVQRLLQWDGMDWFQEPAERLALHWEEEWTDQPHAQLRHKVDKLSQLPGIAISMLRLEQSEGCSEIIQAAVDGFGRQALRDMVAFSGSLAPKHMTSLLEGFAALWRCNAWSSVLPRSKASILHEALDRLAQEAMGSLASRNSAQPRFDPGDLVVFLQAVQSTPIQLWSAGTRGALLDKAASYIVHRIQLRHLIAVNRTDDIVAILEVYAALQHRTLTTQDLLAALALQACRSCAAAAEESRESRSSPARAGWRFSQAQIATLLMCYVRLRCHPGNQVLMALTAQYVSETAALPHDQYHCAPMLPALYCMGYDPGQEVCTMLQQQAVQTMSEHNPSPWLQTGAFAAASIVCMGYPLDPSMAVCLWKSLQQQSRSDMPLTSLDTERMKMHVGWWALCKDSNSPQHAQHMADCLQIFRHPAEEVSDSIKEAMDVQHLASVKWT